MILPVIVCTWVPVGELVSRQEGAGGACYCTGCPTAGLQQLAVERSVASRTPPVRSLLVTLPRDSVIPVSAPSDTCPGAH